MRVFQYGARMPITHLDVVEDQMRLAVNYYNTLIEVERLRRVEYENLLLRDDAYAIAARKCDELNTQLIEIRDEIQRIKQRAQEEVATPIESARAKKLDKELNQAWAEKKKERKRVQEVDEIQRGAQEINSRAKVKSLEARHASGLYWCTYNLVGDAVDAAKKWPKKLRKHRSKAKRTGADKFIEGLEITAEKLARESYLPHFKLRDGSGHVSAQIQYGISVKDAVACKDSQFQLVSPPDNAWDTKKNRRTMALTIVRMRIGPKDNPVMAEIPVYMHRPLPEDGIINQVHLIRQNLAGRSRWKLQLSVKSEEKKRSTGGSGAIGIDIGWRKVADYEPRDPYWHNDPRINYGLRVGYWCDDHDNHGAFVLDPEKVGGFGKVEDLRSIKDKNLNELKTHFRDWFKTKPLIPEWFRKQTKPLHAWRAFRKFVRLYRDWSRQRFDGDEVMYGRLTAWKAQDDHLWKWECNQRDRSLASRLDQYRVWAAQMADKYNEVVLEGEGEDDRAFDLRPLAEQANPEDPQDRIQAARHNRMIASVASMRSCFVQAFWSRGKRVIFRDRCGTTERHAKCKRSEPRSAAIMQTCSHCGVEFDRDENAARNLVMARSNGPEKHLGQKHDEVSLKGSRHTRARVKRETEKAEAQQKKSKK